MSEVSIISTKKFKDVVISLRFASENQTVKTQRALLSLMLSDRSSKYNSKVKMNQKLDNMFGANLSSSVFDYGQSHIIEFSFGVLNEKFVKADLLSDQIDMLYEIVYHPLLSMEVFLEAKQILEDILNRDTDNLASYTRKQALKLAGQGYPLANNRIGNLKALKSLTLDDVKAELASMLLNDVLNIIVIGDVEKEKTEKMILNRFTTNIKNDTFKNNYLVKSESVKEKTEIKDTQQAYMTIVYDTNTLNVGAQYWHLQIMSMILGQLPNSFLFQEVREKRSLCYSIGANVSGYDGTMIISAGVRLDSVDQAIELSQAQVVRIINDEFSDDLFQSAITMLINGIYKTDDSNRRMIDSQYRRLILNEDYDTDGLIQLVKTISRQDVVAVASKLKLNTIYKVVGDKNNA